MSNYQQPEQPAFHSIRIPLFPTQFKKLGDLLYYEGPLFSHLVNEKNEDFLMKWCGQHGQFNRWLLVKTNEEILYRYFKREIADIDLFLKNPDGFAYVIDIDNDIEWRSILLTAVADLPEEYLPERDAFYEPVGFEPYAEKLHAYLDLHLARQNRPYKIPETPAMIAAEPPSPDYGKKL